MASDKYSLNNRTIAGIIVIGILYLVSIYIIATKSDFDATKFDMLSTIRYVNAQYTEFQKLDSASQVKSMTKAMGKVDQTARNLIYDKSQLSPELLKKYTEEQRLTGLIVLDANGQLVCEYNKDRFGFTALRYELQKPSVMDIAKYKEKIYSDRLSLNDGSYIDLAVGARLDAPGVIAGYYHTTADYADNYNMSVQTLFAGYSMQTSGTIIISDGKQVIASNDGSLLGSKLENNDIVNKLKKAATPGELVHILDGKGADYYGSVDKGRNYYIYIYFPEATVFTTRVQKVGYGLILYLLAIGVFLAFRTRTEKKYLAQQRKLDDDYKEQLREAARVAKNANKAKTEFLQRMSHDIRTPINGIRGLVQIGDYYADDLAKQAECRRKIWQSSGFLLDLVNEVLDMGKLSSGEVTLEEIPFDLREILSEVVTVVTPQAKAKNVEIIIKNDDLHHQYLIGSPAHIKRILLNVLGNAVKYNKENGKVYLSRRELSCEKDFVLLEFQCEDTGIGISKRFLPHVFEPFAQDGDVARSSYEGTGLGMPIVKSLIEKMGGTVMVASEQGVGSTFTLTIPFKIDKELQAKQVKKADFDAASARGMHVLLAEDNTLNMEIAKFFLDNAGVSYKAVNNGKEAVEAFSASAVGEYDAILMDVMMPFMNGMDATRAIRALAREDAKAVPIIAMTANAFVEDKQQALEAGMTEYVTKPLQADVLVQKLAQFAKSAKKE